MNNVMITFLQSSDGTCIRYSFKLDFDRSQCKSILLFCGRYCLFSSKTILFRGNFILQNSNQPPLCCVLLDLSKAEAFFVFNFFCFDVVHRSSFKSLLDLEHWNCCVVETRNRKDMQVSPKSQNRVKLQQYKISYNICQDCNPVKAYG